MTEDGPKPGSEWLTYAIEGCRGPMNNLDSRHGEYIPPLCRLGWARWMGRSRGNQRGCCQARTSRLTICGRSCGNHLPQNDVVAIAAAHDEAESAYDVVAPTRVVEKAQSAPSGHRYRSLLAIVGTRRQQQRCDKREDDLPLPHLLSSCLLLRLAMAVRENRPVRKQNPIVGKSSVLIAEADGNRTRRRAFARRPPF